MRLRGCGTWILIIPVILIVASVGIVLLVGEANLERFVKANTGQDVNIPSIPFLGEKGAEVLKLEPGPEELPSGGETPAVPQPTPVPPAPAPTGGGKGVAEVVVNALQDSQTIVREVGETRKAGDQAIGFPICTGVGVVLLIIFLLGLFSKAGDKIWELARKWVINKLFTAVGVALALVLLLGFQVYSSYEAQGSSYINALILSLAPYAFIMVLWEFLHRSLFERGISLFGIDLTKPITYLSRIVEILISGGFAVGSGFGLFTTLAQEISNVPVIGLFVPSAVQIAEAQSASAQGWGSSAAATSAIIGALVIWVILAGLIGGFGDMGHSGGPPQQDMALQRRIAAKMHTEGD